MSKNAYILSWTKEFIAMSEIFSLISKYISIITKQICEKYGYDISQVVAFGDTTNDLEMVRDCGTGVCMCNGTDDVKAVADIITTDSNDEDGLAKTLKEVINNVNWV